ncbi:5757_t:CDS:2 [Paraglomus occultum]|uniref:5757_t:CDS:1 n=1 Tax=Paraglomus occultum TaxID=144539 RepID=A0A9N9A7A7_9GLOM|nr:5757_t:CDS:2 [Paraglomus occultum]
MLVPAGYKDYKVDKSFNSVDKFFYSKPLELWNDFDAFAKEVAGTCSTPDTIFKLYCSSLKTLRHSTRIPKSVRDYAGALHDLIRSTKRVRVFEQARLAIATACEKSRTAAAQASTTGILKRSTYAAMAEFGIEYTRSIKKSRTSTRPEEEDPVETKNSEEPENLRETRAVETADPEVELTEDEDDLDVLWEPESPFIDKLRKILRDMSKSNNYFDKKLAQNGIIRLSSRKEDEPSQMKNEVKKRLTDDEINSLKSMLQMSGVDALDGCVDLSARTLPEMRQRLDNCGTPTSEQCRAVRVLQDLFVTGLEGKADLLLPMPERTWTVKYIAPLFERCLGDAHHLASFWCEKGDVDVVKSREKEHNLWDGVFCDVEEMKKPHMLLIEVSGGTDGVSKKKAEGDLLKLANGMKRHLIRVGCCIRGIDITRCRELRVAGVHIIANVVYFQAMMMIGKGVFIMWEWSSKKIPRSIQDMWSLPSTLGSIYTLKALLMRTKSIIVDSKYTESKTYELDHSTGLSSPARETDTPWESYFDL